MLEHAPTFVRSSAVVAVSKRGRKNVRIEPGGLLFSDEKEKVLSDTDSAVGGEWRRFCCSKRGRREEKGMANQLKK
jgi:hypothetical protein